MLKRLINLANFLDGEGFVREANHLDSLIKKLSYDSDLDDEEIIESYASVISSYVENHPNEHEFDLKNANLPSSEPDEEEEL
tara:strand:- start:304 stop:549 length:246 start_codon:yes stop_codon:yes gene_type:complete